jgi:tetraacyldisaccharide 4'-kinase
MRRAHAVRKNSVELFPYLSRALETNAFDGRVAGLASRVWGRWAVRGLARPLRWSEPTRVICVGGATLGGSGKTPLALACAEHLALEGRRVALVGHAYRARPGRARIVEPDDDVREVGDEALVCARELAEAGSSALVVVAPSRQEAFDLAARAADVVVLDGPLQLAPRRAHLALLAVDSIDPWGGGACPPAGDLRAPARDLVAACDAVVAVGPPGSEEPLRVEVASAGAHIDGRLMSWRDLSNVRVGLYTALARPRRVLDRMARHGLVPAAVVENADHAPPSAASLAAATKAVQAGVELWVATAKCRTHLGPELAGAPVATLDDRVHLSSSLVELLSRTLGVLPG